MGADSEFFSKFPSPPDAKQYPHAYRWYIHIAALKGVRGLYLSTPVPAPAPAVEKPKAAPKKKADDDDDDDFDVFGDDDEEEEVEEELERISLHVLKEKQKNEQRRRKQSNVHLSVLKSNLGLLPGPNGIMEKSNNYS